jgi:NADPH:quinone reductase-like Zn-dependent oxidoreductase
MPPSRANQPLRRPRGLDVVDLPDPTPGEGQQLFQVTAAGVNYADTHHSMS